MRQQIGQSADSAASGERLAAYTRCPQCLGKLAPISGHLACCECGATYPFVDGILSFWPPENDAYVRDVDFLSPKEFDDLNNVLQVFGTEEGKRYVRKRYPQFYDYLFLAGRADWRFYIPLDDSARIADLGCGWGALAYELALECGGVTAVDASLGKLRFLESRLRAEGISNTDLVHADLNWALPFADEYFDLVVLNGVLEWMGAYKYDKAPIRYQEDLLQELHRVLRPGGWLYVGIENRYGYKYFLGKPEDHVGLRFVSIMPRRVASWYTKSRLRKEYRTHTYSWTGLRRILARNGFSDIRFLYSAPDYRYFSHLVPVDTVNLLAYYYQHQVADSQSCLQLMREAIVLLYKRIYHRRPAGLSEPLRGLLAKILGRFPRAARHLTPSFSVIAQKAARC